MGAHCRRAAPSSLITVCNLPSPFQHTTTSSPHAARPRRFRRGWNKNRTLAIHYWKLAWQKRLAGRERWEETVQRQRERIQREIAWQAWQDWQAHQKRLVAGSGHQGQKPGGRELDQGQQAGASL